MRSAETAAVTRRNGFRDAIEVTKADNCTVSAAIIPHFLLMMIVSDSEARIRAQFDEALRRLDNQAGHLLSEE
jgi:hypothetical protein